MSGDVYIGRDWSAGGGAPMEKRCPATDEVVWTGKAATGEQAQAAVAAARTAFEPWALTPLSERIAILEAYAEAVRARRQEIAEAISRDMGKALWESLAEADGMVGKVAVSIKAQAERAGSRRSEAPFGAMELTHRPHGVMAVIGPFNFPGHLPNGHIVPALLAGNTVVFKPSPLAPSVAALIAEAFEEAGLPPGVLNIVQGGRETAEALMDGDIDGVLFTGSANAGCAIHARFAGRPEILLALEMGGNNPLIVWPPADADAATEIAFQSGCITTGQRCSCARRLILPEGAFGDDVLAGIQKRMENVEIGSWDEEGAYLGPLVSREAGDGAVAFQERFVELGAKELFPLRQLDRGRAFVRPGMVDVTGVETPDEELFAPFLQVRRVADFETALKFANATRFGLSGGLVSDDPTLWETAHPRMRAGILNRNRPTAGAAAGMPFGGPGLSGNHRPSAWYAADYCAWPQASQISETAKG